MPRATQRRPAVAWFMAVSVSAAAVGSSLQKAQSADTGAPTLAMIKEAWLARQNEAPCVKLTWSEVLVIAKGAFIEEGRQVGRVAGPFPPRETRIHYNGSLLFHEGSVRISENGKFFNASSQVPVNDFIPADKLKVWNGQEQRYLNEYATATYPTGLIAASPKPITTPRTYRPIFRAMWPLSPVFRPINLSEYRIAEGRGSLADRPCLVLKRRGAQHWSEDEIWVDPSRRFLILRTMGYYHGMVSTQVDIEYQRDAVHGWRPSKWMIASMKGSAAYKFLTSAEVAQCSFDVATTPRDFTIEFPVGTWIRDQRTSGDTKQYIVRPGGKWRRILDSELRPDIAYDKLFNTDTGGALDRERGWAPLPLAGGLGAIVLLLAAAIVWRRWKRED